MKQAPPQPKPPIGARVRSGEKIDGRSRNRNPSNIGGPQSYHNYNWSYHRYEKARYDLDKTEKDLDQLLETLKPSQIDYLYRQMPIHNVSQERLSQQQQQLDSA